MEQTFFLLEGYFETKVFRTEQTVFQILSREFSTLGKVELSIWQHQTFHDIFDNILEMEEDWPKEVLIEMVEGFIKNEKCQVKKNKTKNTTRPAWAGLRHLKV